MKEVLQMLLSVSIALLAGLLMTLVAYYALYRWHTPMMPDGEEAHVLQRGAFALFADHGIHFLLCFCYGFLNTCRMYTAVHDELFQRNPGHLTADGIKG